MKKFILTLIFLSGSVYASSVPVDVIRVQPKPVPQPIGRPAYQPVAYQYHNNTYGYTDFYPGAAISTKQMRARHKLRRELRKQELAKRKSIR